MNHSTKSVGITYATARQLPEQRHDDVATEEPMEVRLRHQVDGKWSERSISITMRTPGNDAELAVGFLFTEGIIREAAQVDHVEHCGPANAEGLRNVVKVTLSEGVDVDVGKLMRNFYTTSSCGVCGKTSLEALNIESRFDIADTGPLLAASALSAAPDKLRELQQLFDATGGIHASGLLESDGELVAVREDVGRHNALDKLIGQALQKGHLPLTKSAVILSGRASFELLQKSLMAGVPIVAAVGAPSSLAIECAEANNMTLVGFLRGQGFNIYSHPERISMDL
ncbi:MAG: formate dehydrogenase accessory sulfurtransferase FdhD [Gammaproteobacteria bacterium]